MRLENWPILLDEQLRKFRAETFCYGKADCWLFSASVIDAVTGSDYASKMQGHYKTFAGGLRKARQVYGLRFKRMEDGAEELFHRIPITFAGRGDLILYEGCFGVCDGVVSYVFSAKSKKLEAIKTLKCHKAWRVE